jgi:predicted MFS family arabinose efflux permease
MLLTVSWRVAVVTWSAVGVAAAMVVWWWIPEPPRRTTPGPAERVPVDARIPALACIGAASFVVMSGFFTMLPTIVARGWGVSPAASASFTGWTRSSGLAGALAGGWVADIAGRTRSIAGWHALALAALVTLWFLDYGVTFGLAIAVMTVASCAAATAYYALLGDAYRSGERERIFGFIAAAASLVGSTVTPMVLGIVLDRLSARAALVTLAAGPLMGLGGLAFYRSVMRGRR